MSATVAITGLGMRFGDQAPALDGIDAAIHPGRVTGLVGPDGAGKTTLIRLIAGLLVPTEGRIDVAGHDSVADSHAIHRIAGYMPQRFGLYDDLSVMENLRLYAELRELPLAEREDTFTRLLWFTDLAPFTERLAGRLSGGMKQKLGLACALLRRPRLLLLDEPSVGVDPISRRELWSMVAELAAGDTAVLWSTAYLDEAERCDTVLLLNEGRLVHDGAPGELTARIARRSVQLRGVDADRRGVLTRALEHDGIADGIIQGRQIRLMLRDGAGAPEPAALGAPAEARFVTVEPRFEDAFVDVLGGGPGGRSALAERTERIESDGGSVVVARGLTKTFGDFTAASDIRFEIPRGEIFGLLGPNGAGKSTTFKMMCGLLRPTGGAGHVAGYDLMRAGGAVRARIGYMAQKFSLYGQITAGQNLEFFSGVYGLKRGDRTAAISEMIEIFGLEPYLGTPAEALPLGFKQRLALACATMHRPEVLFLDEPTSGVDPLTRREFWGHINGMVRRGVTVMVTTHFMDEAEYCDRIALVYHGRIIATGTPDALKYDVRNEHASEPSLEDAFIALIERAGMNAAEAA